MKRIALLLLLGAGSALPATALADHGEAEAGGPYSVPAEGTVTVDGSDTDFDEDCEHSFEYRWDLDADGAYDTGWSSSPTAAFSAAGLDGPTSVTVTLQAHAYCDPWMSDTSTASVSVSNVAPVITAAGIPGAGDEGATLAFSLSYTDVEAADTHTVAWSFGDSGTGTGAATSHTYADDGTYTVTATVTDDDGASASASSTVVVANVAPTITSFVVPGSSDEGAALAMSAAASDPGADSLTFSWDFGDGGVASGASVTHTYADSGTYVATLTVTDGDGGSASSSQTVSVANVAPSIASSTVPAAGDEGDLLTFAASASDPGASDVLTYTWSFGDGDVATGTLVTHAYADDGDYDVVLTVDDGAGADAETYEVSVANVAPTMHGEPAATVDEGSPYSFAPTLSDAGTADTHAWAATALPLGASADAESGEIAWSPTWQDLGVHELALVVTDDDGGEDSLSWSVEVLLVDADEDGLSDGWEAASGLDPADPSDAAADPDGDGRTNAQEWEDGTDAQAYEGPGAPSPLAPVDGEEWNEALLVLTAADADSPLGEELTYRFELLDESGAVVWSAEGVATGTDGTTAIEVDAELIENAAYSWRAAAEDAFTVGAWSLPEAFVYNAVNEPPGVPVTWSPFDGSTVADPAPVFEIGRTTDPDGDALTYSIVLREAAGGVIGSADGLVEADEAVLWDAAPVLDEGAEYCWFGWATDEHGLDGDESADACFVVDSENLPPDAPTILVPEDGSAVNAAQPEIVALGGIDPEGRATRVSFELDASEGFDSAALQTAEVAVDGEGLATWIPEVALADDALHYLRAATSDGAAVSDWVEVSFFVNTDNGAPTVPVLDGPADGGNLADGGLLTVLNATDPESDELTYEFVVWDADGEAASWSDAIVEDPGGVTGWAPGVLAPGTYTWTARAIDRWALASDWADAWGFVVLGTEEPVVEAAGKGCSCSAADRPGAGLAGLLLGLLMLAGRRRVRT